MNQIRLLHKENGKEFYLYAYSTCYRIIKSKFPPSKSIKIHDRVEIETMHRLALHTTIINLPYHHNLISVIIIS